MTALRPARRRAPAGRPAPVGATLLVAVALVGGCSSGGGSDVGADRPSSVSTAAAPPATGPGSRELPVPLETAAPVSDRWQVKVVRTVPDAAATLREAGQGDAAPPAGRQFFLATVEVTYRGGGTASPQYSLTFKAVDGQGTYTDASDGCGVLPDPIPAADVVSGATVRGSVCWAVRTAHVPSLLMLVDAGFLETDRMHFALR